MCGYIRRTNDSSATSDMLIKAGLEHLAGKFNEIGEPRTEHFYPAFGGNPARQIRKLIIAGNDGPITVDATWWFDCHQAGNALEVGKRTTFNARNLDSPYWKGALQHNRAVVVATGLGESKVVDGKKRQYLMEGERPFLMGALYRAFDNGCYSCAVITRDSHPRFDAYHDKAFPLFLPDNESFVHSWLNDTNSLSSVIEDYLENPRIIVPFRVGQVRTFKDGCLSGNAELLKAD